MGHFLQNVGGLECVEDRVGAGRIEIPETLRLSFRQVQTWHLGVL
ncbi:MAG TPA: hypothetical protein VM115_09065 [Vicinamibacterales bacterium]|nr:hypothetical protein [Vicinamibacterales bacterium]